MPFVGLQMFGPEMRRTVSTPWQSTEKITTSRRCNHVSLRLHVMPVIACFLYHLTIEAVDFLRNDANDKVHLAEFTY